MAASAGHAAASSSLKISSVQSMRAGPPAQAMRRMQQQQQGNVSLPTGISISKVQCDLSNGVT